MGEEQLTCCGTRGTVDSLSFILRIFKLKTLWGDTSFLWVQAAPALPLWLLVLNFYFPTFSLSLSLPVNDLLI